MSLTSRMSRRRFPATSGRVAAGLAGVLAVAVAAGCGSSGTSTPSSAAQPSGGASVLAGGSR